MNTPKIALITGGSRGLGRNIAQSLAKQGTDIFITYLKGEAEARAVVAEIHAMGQKAVALKLDTGDSKSFAAFFEQVKRALSDTMGTDHIDFLVNNAGAGLTASFADTTEEQFDLLLNAQFKGIYFLTQKALPLLNDGGGIVNISSSQTRFVGDNRSAYASVKGAVEVLTKYLAQELGPRGIRVNAVAPGAIATDFSGGVVRDNPKVAALVASVTALGRTGQPSDIGGVVAFLCSDAAKWVTAQRIEASGGTHL